MPSILEEFAYGNISPQIQSFDRDSPYGRAIERITRIEQTLLSRLNTDDKALLERYVDAQGEASHLTAVTHLIRGYRLGLTMAAEAFVGMSDLYIGVDK